MGSLFSSPSNSLETVSYSSEWYDPTGGWNINIHTGDEEVVLPIYNLEPADWESEGDAVDIWCMHHALNTVHAHGE